MGKVKLILILILGITMIQCTEDAPETYTLDKPFEVPEAGLVTLTWGDADKWIDLMVIDINESRCPSDVVCIRYGEAEVKIVINGTQEILQTLDLCLGDCPQSNKGFIEADTAQVELDGENYAVILTAVTPYPTTTNQSTTKKAVLKVISE